MPVDKVGEKKAEKKRRQEEQKNRSLFGPDKSIRVSEVDQNGKSENGQEDDDWIEKPPPGQVLVDEFQKREFLVGGGLEAGPPQQRFHDIVQRADQPKSVDDEDGDVDTNRKD